MQPLAPSKPLREKFLDLYLISELKSVLLKDLPLENKKTDSRTLVLPEPFGP